MTPMYVMSFKILQKSVLKVLQMIFLGKVIYNFKRQEKKVQTFCYNHAVFLHADCMWVGTLCGCIQGCTFSLCGKISLQLANSHCNNLALIISVGRHSI